MKKLISIDYLRAASVLYIVGYWHLFNYTKAFPGYFNIVTETITRIILGLFVLLSGYLIGLSVSKHSNAMEYYKKRLARIYPLYAISAVSFALLNISDLETIAKSLIFVSMYHGPPPRTLWFITMIFIFYILAPLITKTSDHPKLFLCTLAGFSCISLASQAAFGSADPRMLMYAPCFWLGIFISQNGLTSPLINKKTAIITLSIGILIIIADPSIDFWYFHKWRFTPIIASGSYLIFYFAISYESKFKSNKAISIVSYGSFALYLFHRPFFSGAINIYFPASGSHQLIYLIGILLVIIIPASWLIQYSYDHFIGRLAAKK